MKHLLNTSGLPNAQVSELLERLRRAGILVREVQPSFLNDGGIWVHDSGFTHAKQLLHSHSSNFAAGARQVWQEEWRTRHGRSYSRWLADRFARNPVRVSLSVLLLGLVGGAFLVYPLIYALRRVI